MIRLTLESRSKEYIHAPKRYLKFSVLYFPLWILVSWAIYEAMFPHYNHTPIMQMLRSGIPALGFSLLLLAVTGVPSFLLLRKRDVGVKGKILMLIVVIAVASFLVPRAYSSYVNKMRLQEYIKDLEYLRPWLGCEVKYVDHFAYGPPTPTWMDNYTDFIDIVKTVKPDVVTISAGVPYHFIFFFPRTIEMIARAPYNGYYISYRVIV